MYIRHCVENISANLVLHSCDDGAISLNLARKRNIANLEGIQNDKADGEAMMWSAKRKQEDKEKGTHTREKLVETPALWVSRTRHFDRYR
jgi:hypothetical protein